MRSPAKIDVAWSDDDATSAAEIACGRVPGWTLRATMTPRTEHPRERALSIPTVTAQTLSDRIKLDPHLAVVDVRTDVEWLEGHIPSALHLPLDELTDRVKSVLPDLDVSMVVYCEHGIRSAQALRSLRGLGYTQVEHLESGLAQWKALGLMVSSAASECTRTGPTPDPARYARQMLLAPVGIQGQARLSRSRVLIVGVGGLGSATALYLAGAGVGTLGLVDSDQVELSNLHRQVIHTTPRLGMAKVESARAQLAELNPEIRVEPFAERLTEDNADRLIGKDWDVVVDGGDNFALRYALNDAAARWRVPLCHGSVDRFEGRVTTFVAGKGPCYRCLFPRPPEPGLIGNCAARGVLGVLPGMIGILQATEALKILLEMGQPLIGRLLTYDALALSFRELRFSRDPKCVVCSQSINIG